MNNALIQTNAEELFSEICDEVRLFYPAARFFLCKEDCDAVISVDVERIGESFLARASLQVNGRTERLFTFSEKTESEGALEIKKTRKRAVKVCVFRLLQSYRPTEIPWGSLTGIRPTKLYRDMCERKGDECTKRFFSETYDVSAQKIDLLSRIASRQAKILDSVSTDDLDVYVGVPFCPSRCSYCSFASNDISKCASKVDAYLETLFEEIDTVAPRKNVRALYIGGGTPTAFDDARFSAFIDGVRKRFEPALEFCVEAGRPDSITPTKLKAMKAVGVTRLSVNTQSLKDDTLTKIGRRHTSAQFFEAFSLARAAGFDNINVDIIVGLPDETADDISRTVRGILSLNPESVTVHTLAIKRASKLNLTGGYQYLSFEQAQEMVAECTKLLFAYEPYYMYRQKHMMGNLENVGYAKIGRECVYNIDIMEETVSILAFGAGGISKRIYLTGGRIERAPNVSDLDNYFNRVGEMAERKRKLFVDIL